MVNEFKCRFFVYVNYENNNEKFMFGMVYWFKDLISMFDLCKVVV